MGLRLELESLGPSRKIRYDGVSRDAETGFREKLEFHYLDVWDAGYGYDCVRMNQPIIDGSVNNSSTHKIQHISADHQDNSFSQTNNCASIEFRLRR